MPMWNKGITKLSVTQVHMLDVWYSKGRRNKSPPRKQMAYRFKVSEKTITKAVRRSGVYASIPRIEIAAPREEIAA